MDMNPKKRNLPVNLPRKREDENADGGDADGVVRRNVIKNAHIVGENADALDTSAKNDEKQDADARYI